MSSLWTPAGEHRVPREPGDAPVTRTPVEPGAGGGNAGVDANVEAEIGAEMLELERELVEAPAEDVIANHCYGMFQLAALHLGQTPPHLDAARLAIDAFAAVVDSLGARLGPASPSLRDGLAQIRLAFVQISAAQTASEGQPAGSQPLD